MGRAAPDRIIGVHVNALVTFPTGDPADMAALTEADRARLAAMQQWQERSGAYLQLQGTRPQTIAHPLSASPAGPLAWIVEEFQDWTDPAAKLPEDAQDRDKILTDVSVYWFTGTARSPRHGEQGLADRGPGLDRGVRGRGLGQAELLADHRPEPARRRLRQGLPGERGRLLGVRRPAPQHGDPARR